MKKYIPLKEACEITGLSRISLKRHIKINNLKCYKPKNSNKILFTEKQIRDFVKSGSQTQGDRA